MENLTYFSSQDIRIGDLVLVPLRGQLAKGIILNIKPIEEAKANLKSKDWALKKIHKVIETNYFNPELIKALKNSADYFALQPGEILKAIIPQSVIENNPKIKKYRPPETEIIIPEVICLQETTKERLARYRALIRESFAKRQSIFICLPTIAELEKITRDLSKGIEKYIFVGHGDLSAKEQLAVWKKASELEHPILFIGTPLFIGLPRSDIATIIIERENSSHYKTFTRPRLDWRFVIEELAKQTERRLVLGDNALRSETIYRLGKREISPFGVLKYRFISKAKSQLLTLDDKQAGPSTISDRLIERIENALDKKENIFIYCGQRGVSPITICRDCGLVMSCEVCGSALAIHQNPKKDERVFVCHKCSQIVEIEDDCRRCGGQRLAVLGFGIEKIMSELQKVFPQTTVYRLDSDTIKTNSKAKNIVKVFEKGSGAILLGTELALNNLNNPVDNVIALGLDNLLTIPDWRAEEKIFFKLLQLKQLAEKSFIIQTRKPEEKIFDYAINGNLIDFYRDEIDERRLLNYPPFKILIKLSLTGEKNEIKKEMKKLSTILAPWEPLVYPSLQKDKQGFPTINLLLRINPNLWPDPQIITILRQLPLKFIISVDPISVL